MKLMKGLRTTTSILAALVFSLTIVGVSLYLALRETAVDPGLYREILGREAVQKKIDTIIINSSGLWQLQSLDAQLYGQIYHTLRTEVANPFLKTLPGIWTAWLSGDTNRFDPVMNLAETRGRIMWMLKQAVRSKLPEFFVQRLEQKIERNFSKKVPTAMRMLPLLGVNSNLEYRLHEVRETFLGWYGGLPFVVLLPFVVAGLWYWSMEKRSCFPECLAGVAGGTALMLLMPIMFFSGQITEIAGTIVRLKSGGGVWATIADALVSRSLAAITTPLLLCAGFSCLLLVVLSGFRWSKHRSFVSG